MTTNLSSNIDNAFLRRIHVVVDFQAPDEGERRTLWMKALPSDAPQNDVDIDFCSQFKLSGADIRSVALGHVFSQKAGRTLTGSPVPILSQSDKVWDRGGPGRPPECKEHGHETNHTHGFTLHQLSSSGQSTSTDASHRQKHAPINKTEREQFNGIRRSGSGLFLRGT